MRKPKVIVQLRTLHYIPDIKYHQNAVKLPTSPHFHVEILT
jgi:hypothetical protein